MTTTNPETYFVVGYRKAGDACVLWAGPGRERAEREARRLSRCEGYERVVAERAEGLTEYDRNHQSKGARP